MRFWEAIVEGQVPIEPFLNTLPNGGAVAAILVLSWLHMKQQERYESKQAEMQARFLDEVSVARREFFGELSESRRDYLDQLERLTGGAARKADDRGLKGNPPDQEG